MLIWGSGGDIIHLGQAGVRLCEVCGVVRPFSVILTYRYAHLFWIFGIVTERKYMLICDICQRGWLIPASEIRQHLTQDPIPFMRRWGCLVLIIIGILFNIIPIIFAILVS